MPPPSSPPPPRTYKGTPVPFWFNPKSADAFRSMETRPDDVVLSSLVKAGTTWTHKILHSLLHVYDDDGNVIPGSDGEGNIGANGQVYPDALPADLDDRERMLAKEDSTIHMTKKFFGDFTFEDLCRQPPPRLISTHLFGMEKLPSQLLGSDAEEGKGRLVVVLRNLKDVLCSRHYFKGEPKDGWRGNEHGPGSYARFVSDVCPDAFGSSFDWIRQQEEVVTFLREQAARLGTRERVLVVYYEAMKADLPAQIDRINAFFGRPALTDAKRTAVAEACGFDAMRNSSIKVKKFILRKGSIGDWRNHLDRELWDDFDDVFDRRLGGSYLAAPLRHFQWWDAPGMPPAGRGEWTLDVDPRTWPVFERAILHEGMVTSDDLVVKGAANGFQRPPSIYRGTIPSEKYEAEAGRYHLFVAGVCPWASGAAAARHLLGIEDVISMDVADGQCGAGWAFLGGASVAPWRDRPGPFWIHEAYQLDDPLVTSRITVPVLWDTKTNTIVSNESWEIIKIMSTAFAGMGKPSAEAAALMPVNGSGHPTLIPEGKEELIESQHTSFYDTLLNGVYKAGLGLIMNNGVENEAVLAAREGVYDALAEFDEKLSLRRFLLGDHLTVNDVRLAMNLFRWDCSYREAFVLKGGRGGILLGDGYPHLKSYLRDMYAVVEPVVDFRAIRQYYRLRQVAERSFLRGNGGEYEGGEDDLRPLPDLNEIIASAREPAQRRPLSQ